MSLPDWRWLSVSWRWREDGSRRRVVADRTYQEIAFARATDGYPRSLMGSIAMVRQTRPPNDEVVFLIEEQEATARLGQLDGRIEHTFEQPILVPEGVDLLVEVVDDPAARVRGQEQQRLLVHRRWHRGAVDLPVEVVCLDQRFDSV